MIPDIIEFIQRKRTTLPIFLSNVIDLIRCSLENDIETDSTFKKPEQKKLMKKIKKQYDLLVNLNNPNKISRMYILLFLLEEEMKTY